MNFFCMCFVPGILVNSEVYIYPDRGLYTQSYLLREFVMHFFFLGGVGVGCEILQTIS
jgi:hypothetical protein